MHYCCVSIFADILQLNLIRNNYMPDFHISHNEVLADLMSTNNVDRLNEIIDTARATLSAKDKVVFEETYQDHTPVTIDEFVSIEQFESWLSQINSARAVLGQEPLG